ncbi:MAG: hypothetical protein ABSE06_01485 [Anaerolineaceae bacterium]|jgi:hypothetical protein
MTTFSEKRVARNFYKTLRRFNVSPAAVSATAVHAAITLLATTQAIVTGFTNPDFPRNVTIKGTMAGASLTGNVKIYGLNMDGANITETIALNNNNEVLGNLAFKTVTRVDLPVRVTAADTVSIGMGKKIGLPEVVLGDCVLFTSLNGAVETVRPTVAVASGVEGCTFAPSTSPNGNALIVIYFIAP